jgi:hypothetical protein
MDITSTNINDLPIEPFSNINVNSNQNPNPNNNQNQTQNIPQTSQPNQIQQVSLDQDTINQLVSDLQRATLSGATQLPSRDIPMTTTQITNDPNIKPNYIPPPPYPNANYIENYKANEDILNYYNRQSHKSQTLDDIYNEIQIPLLISVMYFLFQLPFVKKMLYTYIPFLFQTDGNLNMNGFIFTSILFGLMFHILNKIINQFNMF